ncbi:eukaryotic translation initiation factor 3 subunit 8 N-terminus-domain-containing protein [Gautieria morchelliformis]|nr:eukaryotic translation initiation factor 3 subunit 8 N-terminus-domain-containing protein [Gautieria morchelliformis]
MPISLWLASQREVDQLIAIVTDDPSYSAQEVTEDYDEFVERSPVDEKDNRLDDEFTKSLQNIDPHSTEYVDWLKDEKGLYESICQAQAFYEKKNQLDPLARVIMRPLEHIYSKYARRNASAGNIDNEELKRKAISKPFWQLLGFANHRQVFTGTPKTIRDHIIQASKALQDDLELDARSTVRQGYARKQLAQSLADKLGTLIEQNEMGLDLKLGGGSAWADRTDGTKQEKRTGDQAGERRRTGNDGAGQVQEEAPEGVEVQDFLKG